MPTPAEAKVLGLTKPVPVLVLAHFYEVSADPALPAGVLVVARADQVYLRMTT